MRAIGCNGEGLVGKKIGGRREGVTLTPAVICHQACKPGSVPAPDRGGRWPFIWDAAYATPLATNPDDSSEDMTGGFRLRAVPIRSCSRWGLPCRPCYQERGALLPHPFTLTWASVSGGPWRFAFCGTVPGVAPAGRYPAPYLHGARTFLPARRKRWHWRSGHPAC